MRPLPHLTKIPGLCLLLLTMACDSSTSSPAQQTVSDGQVEADTGGRDGEIEDANSIPSPDSTPTSPDVATFDAMASDASVLDAQADATRPTDGPVAVDNDNDGHPENVDCDDNDATRFPGAPERCNAIDDDCDDSVDEGETVGDVPTWYRDVDEDGRGDADRSVDTCLAPEGFVAEAGDCNDGDAQINVGAPERCNAIDDDCDDSVDEGETVGDVPTWYRDADDDGRGDVDTSVDTCLAPEGFVAEAGDCNDGDAQINVGAPERCNAIDDDCDDSVDEGETVGDVPTWYRDADDDGRGDADRSVDTCLAPEGFVAEAGDCNDGDAQVNVGAPERCNAIDDDCDDSVDEGETVGDVPTWYRDADDDGRGDVDTSVDTCLAPAGFVAEAGDCNDGDAQINVGAPERCNGIDDNCDDEVDNGVPNDGAGCVDPGPPALNNRIQRAQLTIRNGNNAGDDGALELELIGTGVTQRRALNNVAWDDHMRNTVDVYDVLINNALFSRGRLAGGQGRIHYDDSDAWAFACVQLSFNGINVYCREYPQEITLDRGATERHSFTLPNPLPNQSIQCTCYDRYLTHGPIIGATGSDRVRIWGRTDALRRVRLRLGVEQNNLQTVSYRYGDPAKDNTFEFDIYGLESDQTYFYQIEVDGQTTPGTFKTAPDEGQAGVYEFAVGSCAKTIPSRHPEQLIFGAIEARDPDMMFMLGDNVYFDSLTNGDAPDVGAMRSYYRDAIQRRGSWAEPHYPPLNVYDPFNPAVRPDTSDRSRWWGSFGRDARADLFSSTPILAVWDDHDFYSNNADAFYDDDRGRKPWTMNSIDMFRQYWPNPDGGQSIDNPDRMGIYFKQTWGDVDIFGLDTRFHRDDTRRHMLGRAQLDWIKRELSASTATFKFVLSGSIFGGPSDDDEKWPWFGAELNEFYSHIWNNGIGGVVLMSGDVHVSAILEHRNPNNRADPYIIYEVISSGLANYGPNSGNPSDYGSIIQMRYLPPFDYDRRRTNAFALVTTNSNLADPRLSVQFYDERGNTACSDCPFQIRRSQLGPR